MESGNHRHDDRTGHRTAAAGAAGRCEAGHAGVFILNAFTGETASWRWEGAILVPAASVASDAQRTPELLRVRPSEHPREPRTALAEPA